MNNDIFIFNNVKFDKSLIERIFSYDVHKLDATDSVTISKYSIALGQYLIYFKSQINKTKETLHKKQRTFESTISVLLTKEVLKEFGTKTAAREHFIQTAATVKSDYEDIEKLKEELILVDGIDKTISDLIATFKRELTRRENELWQIRQERKS